MTTPTRSERWNIEPQAFNRLYGDGPPSDDELARSLAISAKRQADALERIADALWGKQGTTGLIQLVSYVAEAARDGR